MRLVQIVAGLAIAAIALILIIGMTIGALLARSRGPASVGRQDVRPAAQAPRVAIALPPKPTAPVMSAADVDRHLAAVASQRGIGIFKLDARQAYEIPFSKVTRC